MNMIKRYFWSFLQKIIELFGRFHKNGADVLMFHHVSDDEAHWHDASISIRQTSFKALIDSLIQRGAAFAPVTELEKAAGRRAVIVTFDDMFLSAYQNALPVLEENNIPYCVFISDSFIGKEEYLSEKELGELARRPLCTVGFHAKNHLMLRTLGSDEANAELDASALENLLGKKADYLAFPYGSLYACGFQKAKAAKGRFRYAFSTVSARCTRFWIKRTPYYLPRINVCESNRMSVLQRLR